MSGKAVAVGPDRGQDTPFVDLPAGAPNAMTDSKPAPAIARARIAPAGLMFLAITSVGWGFNWPVTKYLIGELPPLTLRGLTGVVGALLLAALALMRGQSLQVPREMWPRLVLAAVLNVTGWMVLMGLALLWLPASEAALIAYTMPVWASLLAWPVLGERPTLAAHAGAGDGVRGARRDHGRQRLCGERGQAAGHHHGAGRLDRLCARHRARQAAADPAAADPGAPPGRSGSAACRSQSSASVSRPRTGAR